MKRKKLKRNNHSLTSLAIALIAVVVRTKKLIRYLARHAEISLKSTTIWKFCGFDYHHKIRNIKPESIFFHSP